MQHAFSSIVLVFCLNSGGCDFLIYGFGPHPRTPRYSFGFSNATDGEMNDAAVDFVSAGRKYSVGAGVLVAGAQKSDYGMPDPIPARAVVSWRTADGVLHKDDVVVADQVKDLRAFKGTIWFKIKDKSVEVIPIAD